jgi:hypothetical protein
MRIATLLWAAALAAQTRDIPFEGNVLHADKKAELQAADHRVELRRGTVVYQIVNSGAPPIEIVTPSVTVQPYFLGEYKVEVKKSGETTITPVGGEVKVSSLLGDEWAPVGRKMIVRGAMQNPEFKIVSAKTGWKWVGEMLATAFRNASFSGGAVGGSSGGDSPPPQQQESSKPAATASAPNNANKGAETFTHGDTRVVTSPGRGK